MMKVTCNLCRITCTSFKSLCEHVLGNKHKTIVAQVVPEELEKLGRLQYFIDKYMKMWVIGLEYVVEKQVDSSYVYTCMLCDKVLNCQEMISHVSNVEHMENYINRHHRDFIDLGTYPRKEINLKALGQVARAINTKFGPKEVRVNSSLGTEDLDAVAGPSFKEAGKENGTLPSTGNDLQTEYAQEGLPNYSGKQRLGCSKDNTTSDIYPCNLCDIYPCILCKVTCTSPTMLYQHVMGNKHYRKMQLTVPEQLKELGSLSYLLRNQLKQIPILGLEYITELKEGLLYKFSCQLCHVETNLQKIVAHILHVTHTERYIRKHHGNMCPIEQKSFKKGVHLKNGHRDVAIKIVKMYGRKEIRLKNITVDDFTEFKSFPGGDSKTTTAIKDKEGDTLLSKYNSESSSRAKRRLSPCRELGLDKSNESYSRKKMLKKSKFDGPPLAKRGRLLPEDDQDALPDISKYKDPRSVYKESQLPTTSTHVPDLHYTTAEQELEFRTNDQLLEYLANFVIKDEEDAAFIQKITQNCIKALTNFQEEEAENQKSSPQPEFPVAHTSRTDPETPDISASKTESHSSDSETTLAEDASNLPLGIPQNEVTEFFFSSIKNMDESEVVGIFQKIATTNPEFQGMNIPAVIRFLKDSGRLKTSLCCEN